MNWKRPIAKILHQQRATDKLLALHDLSKPKNYLESVGWFASVFSGMAVDGENRPIPWLTYPAIAFLEGRLRKEMSLFEFGSGNSTLWWAGRVRRVVSCEHDPAWYERMAPKMPENVQYLQAALDNGYSEAIAQYENEFDVVVIDGRKRVECAQNSLAALKADGVIVWDNTDREKYRPGMEFLRDAGFRQLDFDGMVPILPVKSRTSIFYRASNCFGI